MHRIVIVALDGVVPFDLSIPTFVFGAARLADGGPAYQVRVCGVAKEVDAGTFRLKFRHGLRELTKADTIIIPGVADIERPTPTVLLRALRKAARAGVRVASICTGAFVLAAAELLDGKKATTHWLATADLAGRFPHIEVDPNVLYVDCGQILSSAGGAAGLDLCLHIVRRDYGATVAAQVARLSVVPLERDGGQAQFIARSAPAASGSTLAPLTDWLEENLHEELSLPIIARRAHMSVRSLSRRFREVTGTSPLQWLVRARIHRAQLLLETTALPMERVAASVGFGSTTSFRDQFHRMAGTSPQAYRRSFRSRSSAPEVAMRSTSASNTQACRSKRDPHARM